MLGYSWCHFFINWNGPCGIIYPFILAHLSVVIVNQIGQCIAVEKFPIASIDSSIYCKFVIIITMVYSVEDSFPHLNIGNSSYHCVCKYTITQNIFPAIFHVQISPLVKVNNFNFQLRYIVRSEYKYPDAALLTRDFEFCGKCNLHILSMNGWVNKYVEPNRNALHYYIKWGQVTKVIL